LIVRSLSIRASLLAGFSLILFLSVAQGLLAQRGILAVTSNLEHVYEHTIPSLRSSSALQTSLKDSELALLRHVITPDYALKQQIERELTRQQHEIEVARKAFERLIGSEDDRAVYNDFVNAWERFRREWNVILEYSRNYQDEAARMHFVQKGIPVAAPQGSK
jgi:methyl-accepting chemotaxis protein